MKKELKNERTAVVELNPIIDSSFDPELYSILGLPFDMNENLNKELCDCLFAFYEKIHIHIKI